MIKPKIKQVIVDGEIYDRVFYHTGMDVDKIIEALQQIKNDFPGSRIASDGKGGDIQVPRFSELLIASGESHGAVTGFTVDVSRKGYGGFIRIHGPTYSWRDDC